MTNFLIALSVYVFLFVLLYISVKVGYSVGLRRENETQGTHQYEVVKVVEGTVFALFGLLIAFSFSGAYTRFEERQLKIISEVNLMETAYQRISLLKPSLQENMRNLVKQYIDERITMYQKYGQFSRFKSELTQFLILRQALWEKTVEAVKETNDNSTTLLFTKAINDMFEIANVRIMITRVHPPFQIFILLVGLGVLSAFFVGYSIAKKQKYNLFYVLSFIAITAYTLYVIIDLEFPRIGMIRVSSFDNMLVEVRENLDTPGTK